MNTKIGRCFREVPGSKLVETFDLDECKRCGTATLKLGFPLLTRSEALDRRLNDYTDTPLPRPVLRPTNHAPEEWDCCERCDQQCLNCLEDGKGGTCPICWVNTSAGCPHGEVCEDCLEDYARSVRAMLRDLVVRLERYCADVYADEEDLAEEQRREAQRGARRAIAQVLHELSRDFQVKEG